MCCWFASSGIRMRDSVKLVPDPVGVHAGLMVPSGLKNTMKRLGGAAACARARPSGDIALQQRQPDGDAARAAQDIADG